MKGVNLMRTTDADFGVRAAAVLGEIKSSLDALPEVALKALSPERTALVIVDMVNGFARGGALYSPRVEALIPGIAALAEACGTAGIRSIAFGDAHPADSQEFGAYPPHCLADTEESRLVAELAAVRGLTLLPKNSTNGYLEPAFQQWLAEHPALDTFIVVGDCTDICIQQFSVALKCGFNRVNRPSRVLVPTSLVDTYDYGLHAGDLMHLMALKMMQDSGVELVRGVTHGH